MAMFSAKLCVICGCLFTPSGPNAKFCHEPCGGPARPQRKRASQSRQRRPRLCVGCGDLFTPTGNNAKFCNNPCRPQRKRNQKPYVPVQQPWRTCVRCGVLCKRKRRDAIYCSRDCSAAAQFEKVARSTNPLPPTPCGYCGWSFPPVNAKQKFCCKGCCAAVRGVRSKVPNSTPLYLSACVVCGCAMSSRTRMIGVACASCRRAARGAVNRRKNAKRRGARVGVKFTLQEIAERDGWKCHLCKGRVNRRLSGVADRGPTIDHLVPISAGGRDEPSNVALAHRICNVLRRDVGPAQLRLVA